MPDRDTPRAGIWAWTPRYPRQVGFRGAVLILYGLAWIGVGLGVPGEEQAVNVWHQTWPVWLRMTMWIGGGLIAIFVAWRPPGYKDRLGWAALYVGPAARTISYGMAMIDYLVPFGSQGHNRAWVGMCVYAVMVSAVSVCSRWPEPPATRTLARHMHAVEAHQEATGP